MDLPSTSLDMISSCLERMSIVHTPPNLPTITETLQISQASPENCNETDPKDPTAIACFAELPDGDLELTIDRNRDLTSFTCFPNLPIELRLQIWRHCFFPKPRRIDISSLCILSPPPPPEDADTIPSDEDWLAPVDVPRIAGPLTLQISRESRHETLLHYSFVWMPDVSVRFRGKDAILGQSVCFSATQDQVVIDDDSLSLRWSPYFMATYPHVLRLMKEIIIMNTWADEGNTDLDELLLWREVIAHSGVSGDGCDDSVVVVDYDDPRSIAGALAKAPYFLDTIFQMPALERIYFQSPWYPHVSQPFEIIREVLKIYRELREDRKQLLEEKMHCG